MADAPKQLAAADYQKLLADMRQRMPQLIEFEVLKAKLVRERFLALRSAGFTDQQALDIVKAWPVV
jgi:hypothetical protein